MCLGDLVFSTLQFSEGSLGRFGLHHALQFLETGQAESGRQYAFFLETAMAKACGNLAKLHGVGLFEQCGSEIVGNFKQFEDRDFTEVPTAPTLIADLYFDRIPLGIDSLVRWRWNIRLVQFADAARWNAKLLKELRARLERLFAFVAKSANETLIENRRSDRDQILGLLWISARQLNDCFDCIVSHHTGDDVSIVLGNFTQHQVDHFFIVEAWEDEDVRLLQQSASEHILWSFVGGLVEGDFGDVDNFRIGIVFVFDADEVANELIGSFQGNLPSGGKTTAGRSTDDDQATVRIEMVLERLLHLVAHS